MGLVAVVAYLALTRRPKEASTSTSTQNTTSSAASPETTPQVGSQRSPSAEHDLATFRHALLHQVLNANGNAASASSPPQDPLAAAQATLDQRIGSSAPNSHDTPRLEGMIRPLLEPAVLGEATAELRCGATLCKVTLIAEDDSGATRAATQLSDRLPKTFSNVVVYPESAGHRALYLTTNPADLELSPPQEVVAQQATRSE